MTIKYEGYAYVVDGWVGLLGGAEYTRTMLSRMDPNLNSPEQMAEFAKALADMPADDVLPKRGQRRKLIAAEGQLEDEEPVE